MLLVRRVQVAGPGGQVDQMLREQYTKRRNPLDRLLHTRPARDDGLPLAALWAPAMDGDALWVVHRIPFGWCGAGWFPKVDGEAIERLRTGRRPPMRVINGLARRWRAGRDLGMSTAEYAIGTVAAAAFAAALFKIVTSPQVRAMLTAIIQKALHGP